MIHRHRVRVYIEDIDLAGIVYYANYLKFIERGRSEWVRGLGLDQMRLRDAAGIVFVVRRVEADYLRPARMDDVLDIRTEVLLLGGARVELRQDIFRGEEKLFASLVTLVCMTVQGVAARIPQELRHLMLPDEA